MLEYLPPVPPELNANHSFNLSAALEMAATAPVDRCQKRFEEAKLQLLSDEAEIGALTNPVKKAWPPLPP